MIQPNQPHYGQYMDGQDGEQQYMMQNEFGEEGE